MSKRNLILLIIVLVIATILGFVYFSSIQPAGNGQTSTGTNFFSNFFPFGRSTTTPSNIENPVDVSGYVPTPGEDISKNKLKRISSFPVAGFGVYMKERFKDVPVVVPVPTTETPPTNLPLTKGEAKGGIVVKPTAPLTEFVPAVRYVQKTNGNIYQTFADNIDERKITTNIIPQVHEAFFGNKGESVIMRYLKEDNKTIETFVGSLPKEFLTGDILENNEVKGTFLPENITDLSLSADTQKIFYLFNASNSSVGVVSSYLGDKKTQVFNSPFTEWLTFWPNVDIVTLTTKPSSNVLGYMYTLNPNKKDFIKVLSGINGLTTLTSPSGKLILYSDNNLSLSLYNTETKEVTSTGVKTMPEKCVWNKSNLIIYCAVPKFVDRGNYPDSWYQGEVSFNDAIWKIDANTGNGSQLVDPSSLPEGENTDGIKLALDDNENYLFFVNKINSLLWEYNLK